jgi:hypothetical protein
VKTCLEKLLNANRWRVRSGKFASDESYGWNGCFIVPVNGQLWQVTIADGGGWRHLSVTNAQRRELPPWPVLSRLKDLFFADNEWVTLYIPAKEDYINDHPYVHHLWSPLDAELPKPPLYMV